MKKIILSTILILCICTLLVGCTNSKSADAASTDASESASTPEATQAPEPTALSDAAARQILESYDIIIPTLSIEYKDQLYRAVKGATIWNAYLGNFSKGMNGSTVAPEMLVENQEEPIVITEDGHINIVFSKKPLRYEVTIWNSEDYDASEIIEIEDGKIPVSKDSSFTIYQVKAEFYSLVDGLYEEGVVYYCFAIN